MAENGWKRLLEGCSFAGEGHYPIEAYSEFMPPARLGCKPYGCKPDGMFAEDDPFGWQVTEFEEHFELQPGMENVAHQVLDALGHLASAGWAEGISRDELTDNPYWPGELAQKASLLVHERSVLIMPLALSRTQDDKGRVRWTLFGGSEQGPARPFWKSFFNGSKEMSADAGAGMLAALLKSAYGQNCRTVADLHEAGFRILATNDDPDKALRPAWTEPLLWHKGMSLEKVNYVLSFEPFASLPEPLRKAYLAGRLHLLPSPASLLFWGVPNYIKMIDELPFAGQIPLQHLIRRHESPYGLRIPQSGWIHEPHGDQPPHPDVGPIRNTLRRTHRWQRVHRNQQLPADAKEDHILRVLFSTEPADINLYGKPMARNCQIWSSQHHLLLDGPRAGRPEIHAALEAIKQGGLFGYRMQYPPMRVGTFAIYWHRPLVAHLAADRMGVVVVPDVPLGYLTGYDASKPDIARPIELWPRIEARSEQMAVVDMFKGGKAEPRTVTRVLNLMTAQRLLGGGKLPPDLARQVLMLPREKSLSKWLDSIPEFASDSEKARWLVGRLKDVIDTKEDVLSTGTGKELPASLTFEHTSKRSFEVEYWETIAMLSGGKYVTTANSDCILDAATQKKLSHGQRDLDALADHLLSHYRRLAAASDMQDKVLVGDIPFRWDTDYDYDWWGGWLKDKREGSEERNIMMVIPGRDRSEAVIMADHYDTAYMEDVYYKEKGGSGARLAASGADDNHSATAALMLAAPVFCELSRQGKLQHDIWLVHLTGEEFPADCLGARHLAQRIVEGTLKLRLADGSQKDLSGVRIKGVFVLDMVAHNTEHEPDVFQMAPGTGDESVLLAYQGHIANQIWNASVNQWNQEPARRGAGRGKRSADKDVVPAEAVYPVLDGQVRLPRDPRSTLFNSDGQIFSDAGIPVVLFMENYDINRTGYHDTHDTMANIDLDYGAAVAAIAIETVARAASLT